MKYSRGGEAQAWFLTLGDALTSYTKLPELPPTANIFPSPYDMTYKIVDCTKEKIMAATINGIKLSDM
jgi:hypothetical protein